jgi:prepilin-type N-terminal cleavage/methylation domain-containing protein
MQPAKRASDLAAFRPGLAGKPRGFSLIEMIVVVAILGILSLIAVPSYLSLVPRQDVKSDAKAVANLMLRSRAAASNYQRPVRVLLDCTPETRQPGPGGAKPCRLLAEAAIFGENGLIKGWATIRGSQVDLHGSVNPTYLNSCVKKKSKFDAYAKLFDGFKPASGQGPTRTYGVRGLDGFDGDSFVVVFAPGGEAISYCGVDIRFSHKLLGDKNNYLVSVINATGHTRFKAL